MFKKVILVKFFNVIKTENIRTSNIFLSFFKQFWFLDSLTFFIHF